MTYKPGVKEILWKKLSSVKQAYVNFMKVNFWGLRMRSTVHSRVGVMGILI